MRIRVMATAVVLATLSGLVAIVSVAFSDLPAYAGGCPGGTVPYNDPTLGAICIPVQDPGNPGGSEPGTETTGTATCTFAGQKIPCVIDQGVWFASRQCYAKPADPQPAAGDPVWGANDPTKGKMWYCTNYQGPGTNRTWFYVPGGGTPDLIDPGDV